jgi:hypothetical protein
MYVCFLAKKKVGDYDGEKLDLNGHNILKRALSYQAYQGYLHSKTFDEKIIELCLVGSNGDYPF